MFAQECRKHWQSICGPDHDIPHRPEDKRVANEAKFPGAFEITHQQVLDLIEALRKGRTGGDDGVLAKYLQALDGAHKVQVARLVLDPLEGIADAPPSWKWANVSLIPKVQRPSTPGDYRSITVLPILQKLVLRAWIAAAQPYLQLRRPIIDAPSLRETARVGHGNSSGQARHRKSIRHDPPRRH